MSAEAALPRADQLSVRDQIRLLSGKDVWNTSPVRANHQHGQVPSARMNDGPHGMRVQLDDSDHIGLNSSEPATCFPTAVTLASSWDEELVGRVAAALAEEAKALGVSLVLGPGMNLKRHPLGGRNFEYFSEDPLLTGRLAAAMVEGLQGRGVGACVKHFAANNAESHRFVSDSVIDPRTLRELYLAAFEHVVRTTQPSAVMASYNLLNGVQVSEHKELLTDILREEWGFEGLVVSDWGATADRVAGVAAGMDLEMPGGHRLSDAEVAAAVTTGDLARDDLTRSAQRVIDFVQRSRLPDPDPSRMTALTQEHDELAREAAAAGAVLLSNDGTLPLTRGRSLAVIGAFARTPRYQGAGSSLVNAQRVTTLCEALAAGGVEHAWAPGYDPEGDTRDERLVADAVALASAVDVAVVVVGLPGVMESEGFDRDHLRLPAQHDELVRAVAAVNARTVVLLANGAPVLMPWRDQVAAVLECYLGGQAGGGAMADLLLGVREPGGRLAESFPMSQADVASDPWFGPPARQVQYREGLAVGYRHHVTTGIAPQWAFGHGLGYARTAWSNPRLDRVELPATELLAHHGGDVAVTLTITVHNPSDRTTSDVVQVYRHDRTGAVARPRRELVGFTKVHLAPGEGREVRVPVRGRTLAFYDARAHEWQVPVGAMDLEVGRSSEVIEAALPLQVVGPAVASRAVEQSLVALTDGEFRARFAGPLPTVAPVRPFTRNSTIEEIAVTPVGRRLRAALVARTPGGEATDPATRRMIERSVEELPLRAVASFAGGLLTWPLVDSALAAMNGHPIVALRQLAGIAGRGLGRRLPGGRNGKTSKRQVQQTS